jgi:hypothetical protein
MRWELWGFWRVEGVDKKKWSVVKEEQARTSTARLKLCP